MNDDELKATLSRRDPAAGQPVNTAPGNARDLWEHIMTTPVDQRVLTQPAIPAQPRRRRRMVALAAAAAVAISGAGTATVIRSQSPDRTPEPAAAQSRNPQTNRTMALKVPGEAVANSCAQFDITFLQRMPVAFQGTVVEVADTSVVLRVDHWYRGGQDDITTVRLDKPGPNVSERVDFATGKTYLVTAQDEFVQGCGYTGESTTDLLAFFKKAFPIDN